MSGLSDVTVLSIGSTRGLWSPEPNEERRRLTAYARPLRKYIVLVNAYARHRLKRTRFASNLEAIPTNSLTALDSFLRLLWHGARAIRREGVSLIQAEDPVFTGAVATLLGRSFSIPVNICVYGHNAFDPYWRRSHWLNRLLTPVGRFVLRAAAGIQVDGGRTAASLARAGIDSERIRIKPMVPSDLGQFFALPRPRERASGRIRLLFVGRLHRQKNLSMLAHAVGNLGPSIELVVAGNGPERTRFAAALRQNGVLERVHWLGHVSRAQVVEAFRDADIFVLSSDYEGLPRVLMEAAASGLPIVTTAVSGADETVLDERTGFIVPVRDSIAFADRVKSLVGDRGLRERMGLAGRDHMTGAVQQVPEDARQLSIWLECLGVKREILEGATGGE